MLHYHANLSQKFLRLNTINEVIVVLKIYKKKRLFRAQQTKMKFSIKDFLVNLTKSLFSVDLVKFTE